MSNLVDLNGVDNIYAYKIVKLKWKSINSILLLWEVSLCNHVVFEKSENYEWQWPRPLSTKTKWKASETAFGFHTIEFERKMIIIRSQLLTSAKQITLCSCGHF